MLLPPLMLIHSWPALLGISRFQKREDLLKLAVGFVIICATGSRRCCVPFTYLTLNNCKKWTISVLGGGYTELRSVSTKLEFNQEQFRLPERGSRLWRRKSGIKTDLQGGVRQKPIR